MKIHFLVIGGGVGGLCTALALCRAGHRVTVLEVEDFFEKVCLTHKVQATEPGISRDCARRANGDRKSLCNDASGYTLKDYYRQS